MKSKLSLLITLLIPHLLYAYEPSGRGYDPDAPFLGLPSGDEVWIGLVIGIIALLIGYLILNANDNQENSAIGCLGVIFMIGGFISLLPLLAWVFSILSSIFVVGIVIFIIIIIISFLKS